MLTALNLPVNYYLGSWYFDPKYALNVHEIISFLNKFNDFNYMVEFTKITYVHEVM